MTRPTICLVAFSPISRDARVLRQLRYLSPHYDLIVLGEGPPPPEWADRPGVRWVRAEARWRRCFTLLRLPLLVVARFSGRLFELWYWTSPIHRRAFRALDRVVPPDLAAVHANDWNTLPLALRIGMGRQARVVLDLHEYAPLEFEERLAWRMLYPPIIRPLLRRTAPLVAASITVAPAIADRYRQEFGLDPLVVLNASEVSNGSDHDLNPTQIRLIHHGAAQRVRKLENMILAAARSANRISIDLMLVGDRTYIEALRALAADVAPERVRVIEPVRPVDLPNVLAAYDAGIYVLPPSGFNSQQALPNKLFDFIAAGLAVVVGPAPAMARFVREHDVGLVTSDLDPEAVAHALDSLDATTLASWRERARRVRRDINAPNEMRKLVELYASLLNQEDRPT